MISNTGAGIGVDGLQRPLQSKQDQQAAQMKLVQSLETKQHDPVAGLTGNEIADLRRRVEILERYVANLQRGRVIPL